MTGLTENQTIAIAAATFFVLAMLIGGLIWVCMWLKGKRAREMKIKTIEDAGESIRSERDGIEL